MFRISGGHSLCPCMRTYEATHPWITFRWEPRRAPYPLWLLLGEAAALVRTLEKQPLLPDQNSIREEVNLIQGIQAMAAMEGNTLTVDQVGDVLRGRQRLAASQAYLGTQVDNLRKCIRWNVERIRSGERHFTPASLQQLHAQVLKGLTLEGDDAPGEFRTTDDRAESGGGIPVQDVPHAVERLCAWLDAERFLPEHAEERGAFALVRPFIAQLYLLWIRPFAEGNGRVAWLVTHQLLMEAGASPALALLVAPKTAMVHHRHGREVKAATTGAGDPLPFLAYMVRLLVEGLQEEVALRQAMQREALGQLFVDQAFHDAPGPVTQRRRALLEALRHCPEPVPVERIPHLSPRLAATFARLDRKTLQRDIAFLMEEGLVAREGRGVAVRIGI